MEPDQERSLISRPSHALTATQIGANRILGEMVESSLTLVKTSAREAGELEALVREARRIQGKAPGMSPENIQAFNLFLRAANAGHSEAQFEVGFCYSFALGIGFDLVQAHRWNRLAAENGHPEAQNKDANGSNNEGKFAEAAEWYRKAAEQGHAASQLRLSSLYIDGRGVPQDYGQAYAWARLAGDADDSKPLLNGTEWEGSEWCQEQAAVLASMLSPVQLEKACELYQNFKRKYSAKR